MSVNKVVLINETIPPAFFSRIVDAQRGEEIIDRRIGEPLPRPGQEAGPQPKAAQQPKPGDTRPPLPRTKKAPPPLPKKAPPPLPKEHQQGAGQSLPTTTRVPTKPGSSRDVPPPPSPQEEGRSRGQVEPDVQPGDQVINPAVPWANVQPTPAPPQEPEQKTGRWDLSINTGTPVADPLIPPTTPQEIPRQRGVRPDPSNLTFQPSDHMLITPGTGFQPAPPKVKQIESWPLLWPGGQEIAPPKPRSAESKPGQFGLPKPAMPYQPGSLPREPTSSLQLGILVVNLGNLSRRTYDPIKNTYLRNIANSRLIEQLKDRPLR